MGTVTTPGTILMTLVPSNEILVAEVWVGNDDVGFVHEGQPVKLKFSAFTFQKYGMIDGRVSKIGADATERASNGAFPTADLAPRQGASLAYKALITLDAQTLKTEARAYPLASGMQVAAEIKLGDRSIVEYLLSPVQKAFQEAARER